MPFDFSGLNRQETHSVYSKANAKRARLKATLNDKKRFLDWFDKTIDYAEECNLLWTLDPINKSKSRWYFNWRDGDAIIDQILIGNEVAKAIKDESIFR